MLVDKTDKGDKVLSILFIILIITLAIGNIYFCIKMFQVTEKYNIEEEKAIQEINKILEEVDI